jgi:hypothetical protein
MIAKNAEHTFTFITVAQSKVTKHRIKILFIPSFAFSIAQLCKIKRRTTTIYRLAGRTTKT